MYIMGGQAASYHLNDVWSLDLDAKAWASVTTSGGPPSARGGHSAIFAADNNTMYIMGGVLLDGEALNDVWALDFSTGAWTSVTTSCQSPPEPGCPLPERRSGHSAVYFATTKCMYIFGGVRGSDYFDDVWELRLDANEWAQVTPPPFPAPSARNGHSAVFDAASNTMYIMGGYGGSSPFNDIWSMDLSRNMWASVATSGETPSARYGHSAVVDTATKTMYIMGGSDTSSYLNSLYALDLSTKIWANITTSGGPPLTRTGHSAVLDATTNTMYIMGGDDNDDRLNDVWALQVILAGQEAGNNPPVLLSFQSFQSFRSSFRPSFLLSFLPSFLSFLSFFLSFFPSCLSFFSSFHPSFLPSFFFFSFLFFLPFFFASSSLFQPPPPILYNSPLFPFILHTPPPSPPLLPPPTTTTHLF
jgi:hypothetical protein